jgi:hypothetical protein
MNRTSTLILLPLAALLCSCSSTSTTGTSTAATFTVSPNPATAVASTGVTYTIVGDATHPDRIVEFPWKTSFTVSMHENAGVGRNITAVAIKVQQSAGGIVVTPTGTDIEHYQYQSSASTNRLPANGDASMSFTVWYDLPNKGREALTTISFSFLDDNSLAFTESTQVQVH